MAGRGTRSRALGECKPAIKVAGRTIFEWCLTGLKLHLSETDKIVAVTTDYFEEKFKLSAVGGAWCKDNQVDFSLVKVPDVPPGPAASVATATEFISPQSPVIIVNVDQFCVFELPSFNKEWDVFMPLYVNTTGGSSYVLMKDGYIKSVAEKEMISSYASAGVYGFKKGLILLDLLKDGLEREPNCLGEYYIAPMLNSLVPDKKILATSLSVKCDLGNVDSIERFKAIVGCIFN